MEKNSNLHVLVVSTWYPHRNDKLLGIYHKHFCEALSKAGVKVNMLHIDRMGISLFWKYPFIKKSYQVEEKGYTTYFKRMLNLRRLSFDLQTRLYAKRLVKLYREYEKIHGKPDVIHGQVTVPGGYAACVLGEEIGVPVVITEHASYFQRFMSGREGKFAQYAMDHAAVHTSVGNYMQKIYREEFGRVSEILPNIIDTSVYQRPRVSRGEKLRFASVCALRETKRIDMAVRALKILKDKGLLPDFEYTVVGDGHYAGVFKTATTEMQMNDCVKFVGRKTTEEIAEILSATDIFLVPCSIETFCIPAVEALASGVPVVSTRCCGPEGFLTPECSEFSDVDDVEGFADAIFRMYRRLDDIDESAVRQVAKQFDSDVIADRAISIYKRVIK